MKAEWTNSDSLTTSQTTKAILVIDVEEDMIGEVDYTILTKRNMCNGRAQLKPMPQKKDIKSILQYRGLAEQYRKEGWNACLEEIEE